MVSEGGRVSDKQGCDWLRTYKRIKTVLKPYGKADYVTEDGLQVADYYLVQDNWDGPLHQVEIHNLRLLHPAVVKSLQGVLRDFPEWEIIIRVDVPGSPSMNSCAAVGTSPTSAAIPWVTLVVGTTRSNHAFRPAIPMAGSGPRTKMTWMNSVGLSTLQGLDTTGTPDTSTEGIRFREKHERSFVMARLDH